MVHNLFRTIFTMLHLHRTYGAVRPTDPRHFLQKLAEWPTGIYKKRINPWVNELGIACENRFNMGYAPLPITLITL